MTTAQILSAIAKLRFEQHHWWSYWHDSWADALKSKSEREPNSKEEAHQESRVEKFYFAAREARRAVRMTRKLMRQLSTKEAA